MTLLSASDLGFRYPQQTENLFTNISFSVASGARIGLVGQNGAGKTTLVSLVLQVIQPTEGRIWVQPGTLVVATDQEFASHHLTCAEYAEDHGLDIYDPHFIQVLSNWGLPYESLFVPLSQLSGGERTRARLAFGFCRRPDVLILDEPTNHLDEEGRALLANAIASFPGALLVVSHDRAFLEAYTTSTWWLEGGSMHIYGGHVGHAMQERESYQQAIHQQKESLRAKAVALTKARDLRRAEGRRFDSFRPTRSVKKNGGLCKQDEGSGSGRVNPGKPMRQANVLNERISDLNNQVSQLVTSPDKTRRLTFDAASDRTNGTLVWWESRDVAVADRTLLEGVRLLVRDGDRLALKGPNGCGKTVMLEAIARETEGVSYLRQTLVTVSDVSVQEYLGDGDKTQLEAALLILGSLHVSGDLRTAPLQTLSVGERLKVELTRILLSQPRLLILDEPTNHLSLLDREAMTKALEGFTGALLVVSHDPYFVEALGCEVLDLAKFQVGNK